ncbi:coenzyme F420-0:L-glutamate ligase [Rhodoplanes roseus]|uniref:Coenzyme F420-0:L-glutamate ligase n=1 Tax=Rhodoplanes roseus TaxID=29409 RepID=A0A327KQN0_9BRAD|nr:coenzyme F420-0:L-glutamate ligase [Rhodoplanes roseus]RAI40741.1 coenzyme F420-0:L-glutamate ligase [Rhodoplanes roseus]
MSTPLSPRAVPAAELPEPSAAATPAGVARPDAAAESTKTRRLALLALPDLPLVRPGDDLAGLLATALAAGGGVEPGDVLVLAQKIVSKAEGRYVDLAAVVPSAEAERLGVETEKDARLVEVILRESRRVVRHSKHVLIVEHRCGFVMANAGIDRSNVDPVEGSDPVLLLPEDADASALRLHHALSARLGTPLAVVISDSFGRPWRQGTVGVALGAAGLPALQDLRGEPDLYGRPLRVTETGFADEIAAAASLLMGQGAEGQPAVLVRGLAFDGPPRPAADLIRGSGEDLFR